MTRYGMCGVLIPDRDLTSWWKIQLKVSDRDWAGMCISCCERGRYISASAGGITVG